MRFYRAFDISFAVIYFLLLAALIAMSLNFFKTKELRNAFNYSIVTFTFLCFSERLVSLVFNVAVKRNGQIEPFSIYFYFHYQLPFDLLNAVLLSHLFQWLDAFLALKSIVLFKQGSKSY